MMSASAPPTRERRNTWPKPPIKNEKYIWSRQVGGGHVEHTQRHRCFGMIIPATIVISPSLIPGIHAHLFFVASLDLMSKGNWSNDGERVDARHEESCCARKSNSRKWPARIIDGVMSMGRCACLVQTRFGALPSSVRH